MTRRLVRACSRSTRSRPSSIWRLRRSSRSPTRARCRRSRRKSAEPGRPRGCAVCTGTVGEVVVASSDKAYGPSAQLPYRENHPLQGRTPYDVSKSCADLIAQAYAATWSANVCVVRCGNLFGGGDRNFSRLVPGVIRDVMSGRRPVLRSDGSPVRDYIYVEDAARAYMLLAEGDADRSVARGQPVQLLASRRPVSALEVVKKILEVMGSDLDAGHPVASRAASCRSSTWTPRRQHVTSWLAARDLATEKGSSGPWPGTRPMVEDGFTPIDACRICGSSAIFPVLDLGRQPLANALSLPGSPTRRALPARRRRVSSCGRHAAERDGRSARDVRRLPVLLLVFGVDA